MHSATRPARGRGSARVLDAGPHDIGTEQVGHVVVAHVLEVPGAARVTRHARLPAGVVAGGGRAAQYLVDGRRAGRLRESQALRGEAHAASADVVEGAQVGTHAEIVGHADIGRERQRATRGARRECDSIGESRARAAGITRSRTSKDHSARSMRPSPPAVRPRCHRSRRPGMDGPANRRTAGRARARATPRRPRRARVEVRHHAVLPDQHPEFVADVEEVRVLVDRGAGDPQHVHLGVVRQGDRGAYLVLGSGERHHVGGHPHGTPAEDRHAVDQQLETAAVRSTAIDRNPTRPSGSSISPTSRVSG